MNLIKNTIQREFTITPNALIFDALLPKESRFLFVYMAAKPSDFQFYLDNLAAELDWHPDTLRKYLAPLLESRWVTRQKKRAPKGQFDCFEYYLHAKPEPYPVFSDTVVIGTRQNKALNNKENSLPGPQALNEPLLPLETWLDGGDERLERAQRALRSYLEQTPSIIALVAQEARVKVTPAEFLEAADEWLRYNRDNYPVMNSPQRFLRAGKNSFHSWLRNPVREIQKKLKEKAAASDSPPYSKGNGAGTGAGPITYDRKIATQATTSPEVAELANRLKV